MPIAFFGSSENDSLTATATSINVPVGDVSSIPAGALIIVGIERRSGSSDTVTISGYTQVREIVGTTCNLVVFYKVAAGSDGDVTASWGTGYIAAAAVAVYTGVDTSGSPFVAENGAADAGASATCSTPAVNNTDAQACGVAVFANSISNGTNWTLNSPLTERIDALAVGTGQMAAVAIGDKMSAATGSTTYTATWDGTGGSLNRKAAWLGFLKPDPTGGAGAGEAQATATVNQPKASLGVKAIQYIRP